MYCYQVMLSNDQVAYVAASNPNEAAQLLRDQKGADPIYKAEEFVYMNEEEQAQVEVFDEDAGTVETMLDYMQSIDFAHYISETE